MIQQLKNPILICLSSILLGYSASRFQFFADISQLDVRNASYSQFNHVLGDNVDPLVVQTVYGKVSGFYSYSRNGREYREFLGVPFAQPPVGNLRYEPPLPPMKWDHILHATKYGSKCLQFDFLTDFIIGDENCLFLNIFTPNKKIFPSTIHNATLDSIAVNEKYLFPVIVFLHGGVFMYGGADEYRPEYFMDEDIIVVTTNYRLNSFGFLNTGDDIVKGNMGLKDQLLALQFVRDNIIMFGGDPNRVTLAGHSAGAASTQYHMLSPRSKGLFHQAVSLSGSALSSWAFMRNPKEQAKRYGERLNCPTEFSTELVACLKSLDANIIVNSHAEIQYLLGVKISHFAPSVEVMNDSNAFLIDTPHNILSSGEISSKIPWITGVTSKEGLIYVGGIVWSTPDISMLDKYYEIYLPRLFDYDDITKTKRDKISMKIKKFYFNNEQKMISNNFKNSTQLFTDANFKYALDRSVRLHSKHQPVYLYYYTHKGDFGMYQLFAAMIKSIPKVLDWCWALVYRWFNYGILGQTEKHFGVCHGDDMAILWSSPLPSLLKETAEDFSMSKSLVHTWYTFSKTGDPKMFNGVPWVPVDPKESTLYYMKLTNKSEIISEPFQNSLKFWINEVIRPIHLARINEHT